MRLVSKQKPSKKREEYRRKALEIRGKDKCAFFDSEADMRDFRRIARQMGFAVSQKKDNGWYVWVD